MKSRVEGAAKRVYQLQAEAQRMHRVQTIERAGRLQDAADGIGGSHSVPSLNVSQLDYRDMAVPDGAVVYADPPYIGTKQSQYEGCFDHDAFAEWLAAVDFPVYVSEYTAPPGCIKIAERERVSTCDPSNRRRAVECLFVQERFA